MITPTVGRVVWVKNRPGAINTNQPEAALVTYVWSDTMVNVGGFDANGVPFAYTSMPLWQDEAAVGGQGAPHAEWMPFQKGQAAKTEALEAAAARQ